VKHVITALGLAVLGVKKVGDALDRRRRRKNAKASR
jgi:hypothetical protein